MRLPYVANPVPTTTEEDAAIVERTLARRGARGLQPLDLALIHSPPLIDGWNSFYTNIRTRTSLGDDVRETAISRVAILTKAEYEWHHHAPIASRAGVDVSLLKGTGEGLPANLLAVLKYTDAMTKEIDVPDEVFAELKKHFSDREIVEVTVTVASYNCTSRILVALDIGERNQLKDVNQWHP